MLLGDITAALRQLKGWSLVELAERVRAAGATTVKYQHIQQLEETPSRMPRYIAELARAFGLSVEELLAWEPDAAMRVGESQAVYAVGFDGARLGRPDVRQLPVISYVQAGLYTDIADPYPRGQGMDAITVDDELARSLSRVAFALEIEGQSMAPEFVEGDRVIIDPQVQPRPGDFVVCKLDREPKACFKKYRERGFDSNGQPIIELVPLNPDYPVQLINQDNPGRVIGVMMEHRRRRRIR